MKNFQFLLQTAVVAVVLSSTAFIPAIAQDYTDSSPGTWENSTEYESGGRMPASSTTPPDITSPARPTTPPSVAPASRPPAVAPTGANPARPVTPTSTAPARPPTQATSTTAFLCGQSGSNPATLVQVNGRTLQSPLIVWTTNYFGTDYTPQQRCQMVSVKLSSAIAQNGGRLSNLRLATGTVNNQTVVCYTNGFRSCTANNMLFTLKPENVNNSQDVLARLANFARQGSGGAVYESGGANVPEEASISLEEAVNHALQAESGGLDSGYDASSESAPEPANPSYAPEPAYADPVHTPVPESYPGGI